MHDSRTTIIKRAFLSLIDEAEQEREALLERIPAEQGIRAAVRDLLRHEREASPAFLSGATPDPADSDDRDALFEPGMAVAGRYRIIEQIGEGGFSRVYRAQQTAPITRAVAMKVLKRGMDSQAIVERFRGEQQTLARLGHPNIATVLDAGITEDGRPWFAMELVEGDPVDRYAAMHRLTVGERIGLMLQAMQAIAHAHQHGIIHRDIKPSNILVEGEPEAPRVRVIDFGIAKAIAGDAMRTNTIDAGFVGTPEYCSPEQIFPDSIVDTRTDVYSTGAVLHELLIGSKVYEDATRLLTRPGPADIPSPPRPSARIMSLNEGSPERAIAHAAERATTPAALRRSIRGELDWILLRALAPDPEQRYRTILDLSDDLMRHLRMEPVEAGPPGVAYRARRFVARYRGPVLLGTLLVLSVIGGLIGTTIGMLRARASAGMAISSAERAVLTSTAIAMEAGRNTTALHDQFTPGMPDSWSKRYLERRLDSAQRIHSPPAENRTLSMVIDETARQTIIMGGRTIARFNADASSDRFGALIEQRAFNWDAAAGSLLVGVGDLALVVDTDQQTSLWSVPRGERLWSTASRLTLPTRPTLNEMEMASGSILVLNRTESRLERRSIETGTVQWSMDVDMLEPVRAAVSADETLALVFDQAIGIEAGYDLTAGTRLWERRHFSIGARFYPDAMLVDSIEYGRYETLDPRTGEVLSSRALSIEGFWASHQRILNGLATIAFHPRGWLFVDGIAEAMNGIAKHGAGNFPIRFGSGFEDGSAAFAVSSDDGSLIAWRWPAGSGDLKRVAPPMWSSFSGSVSRDGSLLAQSGWGDVIMWNARTGLPIWRRTISRFYLNSCAIDPQAGRVAAGSIRGQIGILDARTGETLVEIDTPFPSIHAIAWSADGQRLLAAGGALPIVEFDAGTGRERSRYEGHTGSVQQMIWDDERDGVIAVAAIAAVPHGRQQRTEVIAWDAGQSSPRRRWLIEAGTPNCLAVEQPGHRALIGHQDGRITGIDLTRPGATPLARLNAPVHAITWMPGGGFVAGLGDGSIAIFRNWSEPPLLTLQCMDEGSIHTIAYRADDDALVASGSRQPIATLTAMPATTLPDQRIARQRTAATAIWGLAIEQLSAHGTAMAAHQATLDDPDLAPEVAQQTAQVIAALGEPVNALFNIAVLITTSPDRPAADYAEARRLLTPFVDDPMVAADPAYALVIAMVMLRTDEHQQAIRITTGILADPTHSERLRAIAMATRSLALAKSGRYEEAAAERLSLNNLLAADPSIETTDRSLWIVREVDAALQRAPAITEDSAAHDPKIRR